MNVFRKIIVALGALAFCLSLTVAVSSAQGKHGWKWGRHDNGLHLGWYKNQGRASYRYSYYPRVRYNRYSRMNYYTYYPGYNYPYYTYNTYPMYHQTYDYRAYYRPYRHRRGGEFNFRVKERKHHRWW